MGSINRPGLEDLPQDGGQVRWPERLLEAADRSSLRQLGPHLLAAEAAHQDDRQVAAHPPELARADTADPDQRVNRPPDLLLAQLDFEDGDYAAVRDRLTQRIAGWEKAGHGGSATVAGARLLLGRALIETGETEAARAALAAALASLESLRGPDHPATRQARAELERLEPGAGGAKAVSGSKR